MITLDEAKEAFEKKTPVLFNHPMMTQPVICTVGGIEFSKNSKRLSRVLLRQSPNSIIKTKPEYVFTKVRHSKEVTEALEELGRNHFPE